MVRWKKGDKKDSSAKKTANNESDPKSAKEKQAGFEMQQRAKQLLKQQRAEKRKSAAESAAAATSPNKKQKRDEEPSSTASVSGDASEQVAAAKCSLCSRPMSKHRSWCENYKPKENSHKPLKRPKKKAVEAKKDKDAHVDAKGGAAASGEQASGASPAEASGADECARGNGAKTSSAAFVPVVRFDPTAPALAHAPAADTLEAEKRETDSKPASAESAGRGAGAGAASTNRGGEVDPHKVYVGGLPYHWTEDDVREHFKQCGKASGIEMLTFPDSGRFRGIAFVSFYSPNAAAAALKLNGEWLDECQLKIKAWAIKQAPIDAAPREAVQRSSGKNVLTVYVGNLSWDVDDESLKEAFSGCQITEIRWGEDKATGNFRGFGHVQLADEESLEKAVSMDGRELLGRPLRVVYALERSRPQNGEVSRQTPKGNIQRVGKSKQSTTKGSKEHTKKINSQSGGKIPTS